MVITLDYLLNPGAGEMVMEYEAKFEVKDHSDIERALKSLGAVYEEEVFEEDHYIDLYPCIKLRERDEALRVRISEGSRSRRGEITYKGPKIRKDLKARDEITVEVRDPRGLVEIFRRLGFKSHVIRKRRKIYRLGVYKIFLDDVEAVGRFVEIEVEGVSSPEEFLERIKKFKSLIGITGNHIVKSYLELWLEGRRGEET
ncbi:MAG: class IV adenylate cyclase [Sulfolobales archaeon]